MSSRLYCIAEFAPNHDKEQELFTALLQLEALSLREDGCVRYKVTKRVQHHGADSPSPYSIMVNEEWANREAFDLHLRQDYFAEFIDKYVKNSSTSLVTDVSVRSFSDEI